MLLNRNYIEMNYEKFIIHKYSVKISLTLPLSTIQSVLIAFNCELNYFDLIYSKIVKTLIKIIQAFASK